MGLKLGKWISLLLAGRSGSRDLTLVCTIWNIYGKELLSVWCVCWEVWAEGCFTIALFQVWGVRSEVESIWNVMAHGDAREGKWRGNWRMEWVASTLYNTSEHGVCSITTITTADAHTSTASNRLNWRPRRFKWTRSFRRKTKSGFCACAITFQTDSTVGTGAAQF